MNPIIKVITFLFKKNKIDISIKATSIESFFDNGILFPKFVALALKIELIPDIRLNPENDEEKQANNQKALTFLLMNNASIAKTNLGIKTDLDQYNLLKQILIKQCFFINEQEIIHKFNTIVKGHGIQYTDINELISWKSLLLILKVLSNESFQEEDVNTSNSYKFVEECFKQTNIPFVLDENSLDKENRFLFLIQIEILIDFYSKKRHQIIDNSLNSFNSSNDAASLSSSSSDDLLENDFISKEERRRNLFPQNYKESNNEEEDDDDDESTRDSDVLKKVKVNAIEVNDIDEFGSESSEDENLTINESSQKDSISKLKKVTPKKKNINKVILYQNKRDETLLKVLNSLSKSMNMNKNFESIHETIEDDWIPKFVMHFFNIKSIENVYISDKKIFRGLKHLSVLELKNINAVIEFLKGKESKFEVLTFNFSNVYFSESSAILFYTTFLNFFFLKQSKRELFERCITILFPDDNKNKNEFDVLTNWSTYAKLIYFVVHGKKMTTNSKKIEKEIFKKSGIPKIIDEDYLSLAMQNSDIPDEIYYQLQLIFNALDTKFLSSQIVERFRIAISKLKINIEIENIAASIRAKNISLILQIRRHSNFIFKNQKEEENKQEDFEFGENYDEDSEDSEEEDEDDDENKENNDIKKVDDIENDNNNKEEEEEDENNDIKKVDDIENDNNNKEEEEEEDENNNIKKVDDIENDNNNNKEEEENDNKKKAVKNEDDKENEKEDKEFKQDEVNSTKVENKEEEDEEYIPMNYLDRLVTQSNKLFAQSKKQKINLIKFENADKYWNSSNSNCIFENGFLINKTTFNDRSDQTEVEWSLEISKIFKKSHIKTAKKKEAKNSKRILLFNDHSLRNKQPNEFYKIFVYDEQEKKWCLNHDDLNKLGRFINTNSSVSQTPLILFMNSSEQDLRSLNSNLINGLYPNIEENGTGIFIYALCDRFLSHLSYNVDMKNKNKSKIKPIFLLLHVPKEKENHLCIQSIVASIYSYLSYICDLEIVLLDEKNYKNQIKLNEIINKIDLAYKMKIKKEDDEQPAKKKNQLVKKNSKKDDDDSNLFVDEIMDSDNYDEEDSDDDSRSTDNDFEIKSSDLSSESKPKTVFLINETSHEFNEKNDIDLNRSQFFKEVLQKVEKETKAIHFININNTITYKSFLDELNEFSQASSKTFDEIKEKFLIIEIMNISSFYISMKMKEDWKNDLEQMINKRYIMLLKNEEFVINNMNIISKLQKEILENSLPFDFVFQEQCKFIIENLKLKINQKNRDIFKSELELSSQLKRKMLSKSYKDYEFFSIEKVQSIINEHIHFIKEEFFSIIQSLSEQKYLNIIYEDNINILNNQLNEDIREINKLVEQKKLELSSKYSKNENAIDIGTNYSIREAENVREMKILIDIGKDLKSEIDQDF